jgi:hypothetical protein
MAGAILRGLLETNVFITFTHSHCLSLTEVLIWLDIPFIDFLIKYQSFGLSELPTFKMNVRRKKTFTDTP